MNTFLPKITFLLFTAIASIALAWGDLGHEATAKIAEDLLKKDPHTQQAVQDILGVEPMAIAATWPDHVRSDHRFDLFATYHYLTIFRNPKEHAEKDALIILKKYPALLTSTTVSREVKMIALRYLIHVVGDIHQPLHVGNEFDRGGNWCKVKWLNESAKTINLHGVWDTNLVNVVSERIQQTTKPPVAYFGYTEVAAGLMKKYQSLVNSNPPVDVDAWMLESSKLGETSVYPDNSSPDNRIYCQQNHVDGNVPVLPQSYIDKSADIVEQRIVLGGARLASFLKSIFKNVKTVGPVEAQVLKELDIKNAP